MITLRLYAHKIAPFKGKVEAIHFKAIDVVDQTANYLANLYNGKTDCSSCGVIQYSDTLYLPISVACAKQIEKDYPFISISVTSLISNYLK